MTWWEELRCEAYYDEVNDLEMKADLKNESYYITVRIIRKVMWTVLEWVGLRPKLCDLFGYHIAMVDNSYAGPDSGVEDMYCFACGWGFCHIYY